MKQKSMVLVSLNMKYEGKSAAHKIYEEKDIKSNMEEELKAKDPVTIRETFKWSKQWHKKLQKEHKT